MSTPDDHNPHHPPPIDQAAQRSYAVSGKIMLSAIIVLFAVVVFMLILHVYARWYLLRSRRLRRHRRRRTHLVFYVEPPNPSNPLFSNHHQGLDPLLLKSLPTFTFSNKSDSDDVLECAVCLSEFEDGESGRRLPKCQHSFHVDCIDMWFHSHSTCPLCRAPVESASLDNPPAQEIGVEAFPLAESTEAALTGSTFLGPSSSASFGGMGKGFDIEVPARSASFSFGNNSGSSNPEESGPGSGFIKSPRLLALRRMLSREKRPVLSAAGSETGTSWTELGDIEEARGSHGGFS